MSRPIFTENFLSHYLSDFRASSVTDIRGITQIIKSITQELELGKLESLKEEEVKSRFINSFFGDVLGFNYGNSNEWQLREETKSKVDGKKPDATLGYFYVNKTKDNVRVVIEMKDAITDLDMPQKRKGNQTPVEQAFSYVSKMGGSCKWVVVSNMKETRFYVSNDGTKYQAFFLKDLINENKLKELLLVFHKDRFIKKENKSATDLLLEKSRIFNLEEDKPLHIIDKIDKCLRRFDGFGFVDPNFIVTLYPFNILDDHVWQYDDGILFTINSDIYALMKDVDIVNNAVVLTEELKNEIEAFRVIEAKEKLEYAFKFLNHCQVTQITAIKDYKQLIERNKHTIGFTHRHSFSFKEGEQGITKSIQVVPPSKSCDCLSCNYRSLDFKRFLGKLKIAIGNEEFDTLEYAYGNYLAASNNFKTAYTICKAVEKATKGKEGKEIQYFLAKQNIKYLYNLVSDYPYEDGKDILSDIKNVDLDKVIYDEIEFAVDKNVKDYLVNVKEDSLIYKLQDEIEETTFKIEKLKRLYENGGFQQAGPNLPNSLFHAYHFLYLHTNSNFIVYDIFKRYKSLAEKVFKGFVTSYQTKDYGLTRFNEFILMEAILHINSSDLQKILESVESLKTQDECVVDILQKLTNLTSSYYKDSFFGDPYKDDLLKEYLSNYRFRDTFVNIFANLCTVLSKIEISKEQFLASKKHLLNYLKIESELAWFHLKQFSNFLTQKGDLFEVNELMEILRIAIHGDKYGNNKYSNLIEAAAKAIHKYYPHYKIDNANLIQTALLKCVSESGNNFDYKHLVYLVKAADDNCKQLLVNAFEAKLDKKFNSDLYEELLCYADYDWQSKNYFQLYSNQINLMKGGRAYKHGSQQLTDLVFFNYVYWVYKFNIDFERNELKLFTSLNSFETWLLNPIEFDYQMFDPKWLLDINNSVFLNRIKAIPEISGCIERELQIAFEPTLAEIRYRYFVNEWVKET